MRKLLAVVVAVGVGMSQSAAAGPVATGAGCVKEAFARADAGKPEEGLPWLVEALRLDAGKPERLALHRQRLAWVLQAAVECARRPAETADPQPRWNGHGFAPPVHYRSTSEIVHAAISPDGRWVACVQEKDGHSTQGVGGLLWDLQQPEMPPRVIEIKVFGNDRSNTCQAVQVVFAPDSRRVALAFHSILSYKKSYVQVWDCATARPVGPPLHLPYRSFALAFSPDGNHIAAGWGELCGIIAKDNHGARVWEVVTGKPLIPPIELRSAATLVRFSPDGRRLLVGTLDGPVTVWDIPGNKPAGPVLPLADRTADAAFLPDGGRVAIAAGEVNLWDVRTGQRLEPRLLSGRAVQRLWLAADGKQLFARLSSGNDRLLAWDLKTGEPIATEPARRIDFDCVLAPDRKQVFAPHNDSETAHLRDAATGERLSPTLVAPRRTLTSPHIPPWQLTETTHFSNDGRRLLTWGLDELVVHTMPVLAWPETDTADLAVLVAGQTIREGRLVPLDPKERRAVGERLAKKYPEAFATARPAPVEPRDAYQRVELSARIGDAVLAARKDANRADARKALLAIVRQQPDATDAWLGLAFACELDEDRDEALNAYNAVLVKQPHHRDALILRGQLYADHLNKADLARADLRTALDLQPLDWKIEFELALIEMKERQWKTALDLFARADAIAKRLGDDEQSGISKTDYPYIFRNRGKCFAELGRWKEAAQEYRRAVELHDGEVGFRHELVRIYAELKELASARLLCEEMVATLTDETEAHRVDAIAWMCAKRPGLLKDYGPAIRAVERLVRARPEEALYRETLAWLHLRAGQPEPAAQQFDAFAKLHPKGGLHYWSGAAIALQRIGKADAAKEFRDKALAELKRLDDAAATETVSWFDRLDRRQCHDELVNAFPAKTDNP